ncbi:MAG: NAD(P)/FAD-dependent oxidoreductase [Anaerolineae bacterium]|nr:NAD(P)/FAD-dependent oxidoreductase [Anaerolineae bacterium]MCB0200283.1 NAD(P)/FAD-dependent oxidoreductase [Anaerolineae bacterium]MCB0205204.1 NAD(P)/FAD-dependent oxidoreductase [Anaerolineae bacterium]MCB0254203.1 NAD(P)/FAD-dependent oxidoreductase [Anaerolineae bacterium]
MYDLIILGGGPAGLTATVYAIHKRLETLLITEDLGGKSNYRMHIRGLEGYETINGEEVVRRFQSQVEYLDFARLMEKAISIELLANGNGEDYIKVTTESGTAFVTRSLIVATGAQPRMLNVPGERGLLGLGVSYSAISHAPLFWGKETAVVGSDSLAFRAVTELATLASRVFLVSPDPLPTDSPWLDKIRGFDNVVMLEGYHVVSVGGSPHLEEMTVRRPNGRQETLAIKGMFVELGLIPNTGLLNGIVDLDEEGRVVVDCRGATSRPGIYAAGDVTNSYAEQVLVAVGDGAKAALSAYEYLLSRRQFAAQPVLVR